jgi:hypothetical protein
VKALLHLIGEIADLSEDDIECTEKIGIDAHSNGLSLI